jgi:hypothetical protein
MRSRHQRNVIRRQRLWKIAGLMKGQGSFVGDFSNACHISLMDPRRNLSMPGLNACARLSVTDPIRSCINKLRRGLLI